MPSYEEILNSIRSDPAYQANLDWGKPRSGHPEGSIRKHIEELEDNLERLKCQLSDEETAKLRALIHTHDTFKPGAKSGVAIADPHSHASLARQFLSKYVSDPDLLNMVQFHDEPFALWKKHRYGGDYSERFQRLLGVIADWDLFPSIPNRRWIYGPVRPSDPLEWFLRGDKQSS